ncbi:hypothetical protein GCK32_005479 [Trichostrongylus colubriformis]|uniref:Uncharacterized protein n=1 Tax=Trichostrongylus colubriformis TaxID=6319 RepID=A0AAN8FK06_TRICO
MSMLTRESENCRRGRGSQRVVDVDCGLGIVVVDVGVGKLSMSTEDEECIVVDEESYLPTNALATDISLMSTTTVKIGHSRQLLFIIKAKTYILLNIRRTARVLLLLQLIQP